MLFPSIAVRFGIGATIRIGQEIQCLPYAGFFPHILTFQNEEDMKAYLILISPDSCD